VQVLDLYIWYFIYTTLFAIAGREKNQEMENQTSNKSNDKKSTFIQAYKSDTQPATSKH